MARNTTPSNVTSLAFAEETTIGVLPVTPVWNPLEPNSYGDFGPEIETVAREPITSDRQRRKGVTVGLTASVAFEADITDTYLPLLMQGFMFADVREKVTLSATAATGTGYTVASGGAAFLAGALLFAEGSSLAANNGLKIVTASSATSVSVAGNSAVTEAITLREVGFQFASGDAEITASGGALPVLATTAKDCTAFGLLPGEWVFIGGDATAEQFANAANIGWARVKSVTANAITFDKTDQAFVTDDGATKTIRLFFGRVLKNEAAPADQVRRSYTFERQLGAPDPLQPSEIQAEYVAGVVPNEVTLNFDEGAIVTFDMSSTGTDSYTRDAATGPLTGTRPALVDSEGYSGNNDVKRIRMSGVPTTDAAPTPLFAFVQTFSLTINNNVTGNRALSRVGMIDMVEGMFMVSGELTVYFANVAAAASVRNNADVTLDMCAAKNNRGFAVDVPLITLGGGRNEVAANEAITISLTSDAAKGTKYDAAFNHTLLMSFFPYLPTVAATRIV